MGFFETRRPSLTAKPMRRFGGGMKPDRSCQSGPLFCLDPTAFDESADPCHLYCLAPAELSSNLAVLSQNPSAAKAHSVVEEVTFAHAEIKADKFP